MFLVCLCPGRLAARFGSEKRDRKLYSSALFAPPSQSLCYCSAMMVTLALTLALTLLFDTTVWAAYTDEFLQAFRNLGLDPWAGMEMDVAWGYATLRYGLHRPSIAGPIFVYRVCTHSPVAFSLRAQVLTHENLSPDQVLSAIAGQFPDLRHRWAEATWHVATIDSTRGHSRDRSLMHPCYVLIHADDYWAFNQRPHGLVELVLGDTELSFPCILPQMINFPTVQAFLSPLVPGGLDCVTMNVWHNGDALDFTLVNCFDGFFVQVTVTCCRALLDNILAAAPIMVPQLHVDPLMLPDPQFLQVTAHVPGGDTLISSRSASLVDRRDRVYAVLHTLLRQRFPDMLHVGFDIVKVHPSSSWLDPTFLSQKEKAVVVYTDDVLRQNAVVFLRLSFPPYEEEGAIYTLRRLRLCALVSQLGLSSLCGYDGDNCLCYANGIELTNDIEAAVEDAAFISCWMLPLRVAEEVEVVSIADSTSVHSLVTIGPASGPSGGLSCPPETGIASAATM